MTGVLPHILVQPELECPLSASSPRCGSSLGRVPAPGSLCRWSWGWGEGEKMAGYEKVWGWAARRSIGNTGCTYMKFWSIKCSIEHAAEIRIPSWLEIIARSMPRSSSSSICKKSPTVCEMGRNANWHLSLRDGSSTVMFGRPLMYLSVTTAIET